MSGPASASASPGPSGPSYLDLYNQHDVPKPFKRVPTFSNSSTGRRRNYKQIIAFEQEAQFELGGGVSKRRNKKKKTTTTGAAGGVSGSATPQLSADGTRQLMGAAAKAAKKREERLKREQAAQEAAARSEAVSMDGTPVPEGGANEPAKEGEDGLDPDTTMKTEAGEEVLTEAQLAQQKADEQERLRKMNLPTCESAETISPELRKCAVLTRHH